MYTILRNLPNVLLQQTFLFVKFFQLFCTLPIQSWKQYNRNTQAQKFTKLLTNMLSDIIVYVVIAGVVLILEIMDIIEGTNFINKNESENVEMPQTIVITTPIQYSYTKPT